MPSPGPHAGSREVKMSSAVAVRKESVVSPEPLRPDANDAESLDVWGFRDSGFAINENGHAILRGDRYELCGQELPRLLPWIRETLDIALDPQDVHQPSYPTPIPPPLVNAPFEKEIRRFLKDDQITADGPLRLRHGHGQTQEEMFAIKY